MKKISKVAYLGAGIWGYALANLLASKGHLVTCWSAIKSEIDHLNSFGEHPKIPGFPVSKNLSFTTNIEEALADHDFIIESVTTSGLRPVFSNLDKNLIKDHSKIILTSKGIEKSTGLFPTQIVLDSIGNEYKTKLGYLSGPSVAIEVLQGLPTSVVCSAYDNNVMFQIQELFLTQNFRVYPNLDVIGVQIGGALKNIIAIACGASDGLGFGDNAKSALITRGLHEIKRLSTIFNCDANTLNGLSGMGDLCLTCSSPHSRNYRFGKMIAEGLSVEDAKTKIGTTVEGSFTCVSALQLAKQHDVDLPITAAVYSVIYDNVNIKDAVHNLVTRTVKHERI